MAEHWLFLGHWLFLEHWPVLGEGSRTQIVLVTGLADYYTARLLYSPIISKTPIVTITESDYQPIIIRLLHIGLGPLIMPNHD